MWTAQARELYKDDGRRYPSDLTDAEWQTVEPVLRSYMTLTADLREMVNACLYLEKAGCPWRFLHRSSVRGKPCEPGMTASGLTGSGPTSPPCSRGRSC